MRDLLRGKRVYIDTNIFIYVALKHPQYYRDCHTILEMLVSREFIGYGSYDALHAALVAQNGIEVVITEDLEDWGKILRIWPRIKKKFKIKDLMVISPTRGIVKT